MDPMVNDPEWKRVQMEVQCLWRCLHASKVPAGLVDTELRTVWMSWPRTWLWFRDMVR